MIKLQLALTNGSAYWFDFSISVHTGILVVGLLVAGTMWFKLKIWQKWGVPKG